MLHLCMEKSKTRALPKENVLYNRSWLCVVLQKKQWHLYYKKKYQWSDLNYDMQNYIVEWFKFTFRRDARKKS